MYIRSCGSSCPDLPLSGPPAPTSLPPRSPCRDSGDDIELASCPHGQASRDCSMVASCSCELLSEGEQRKKNKKKQQLVSLLTLQPLPLIYTKSNCGEFATQRAVWVKNAAVYFFTLPQKLFWCKLGVKRCHADLLKRSCPMCPPGVYRAPERSCQPAAEHYGAPSVRCREPPFTQHPSHMPLERFLQSPEAQGANSPAGGVTAQRPPLGHTVCFLTICVSRLPVSVKSTSFPALTL